MRASLLSLPLCLLTILLTPAAKADTLDFSFSFSGFNNANDSTTGVVTGEIDLTGSNGSYTATAVYIDSADNNLGNDTLPYNVLVPSADVGANSFTVSGGLITSANLLVNGYDPSENNFNFLELGDPGPSALGFGFGPIISMGSVTFTPLNASPTPEPASIAFLLEGLAAGSCLALRRRRRAEA